jgi:hypothetical protein
VGHVGDVIHVDFEPRQFDEMCGHWILGFRPETIGVGVVDVEF